MHVIHQVRHQVGGAETAKRTPVIRQQHESYDRETASCEQHLHLIMCTEKWRNVANSFI